MDQRRSEYPQRIRTDETNRFAFYTMSVRLPSIIDDILEANPDYPVSISDSLRRLKEEVLEDRPLRSISPPAPDWESWEEQYQEHRAESWLHAEWFFAEHLFYRRVVEAVRWWETGRDPFAPIKEREYTASRFQDLLEAAAAVLDSDATIEERINSLLLFDLWGNRIDLSHKMSTGLEAHTAEDDDLIVDHRHAMVARLLDRKPSAKSVFVVTDNAGSELAMDLLLAGLLSEIGLSVAFCVKMHPTYVSDATVPDLLSLVRRICDGLGGAGAQREGRLLDEAFRSGTVRVLPDLFWNAALTTDRLPSRLAVPFRDARLVILKGDLNYRRVAGDRLWSPDAAFSAVAGAFPAPLALLRTMKSDTVFGLPPGLAERLQAVDSQWRTNGRRGVIQYFG